VSERFPPVAPEAMSEAQRDVAARIAGGPRGSLRGPFLVLLHNPELADRVQALGEHLRYRSAVPQRLVELAVLVTARRWTCQYVWFMHAPLARREGVADDVIAAIAAGRRPEAMTEDEALTHDIAAHAGGDLPDALFAAAEARFGRAGLLDLLAVCGYYTMQAMVLNAARAPLPGGAPPPLA
jgi:4-carboxymuconolactone decarboxylase